MKLLADDTTINITNYTFGEHGIRNGDMIAIINILQWLRKKRNSADLKFYLPRGYIVPNQYNYQFYDYLANNYDYFDSAPGNSYLPYENIMLWDFRDVCGDVVQLHNDLPIENKVVIFPVLDAKYNTMRNWPDFVLKQILSEFAYHRYSNYSRYVCLKEDDGFPYKDYGFQISTDFYENINHIKTCSHYVGGDTGMSHFASALSRGKNNDMYCEYWYSARSMMHSLPFHWRTKGIIKTYSTEYNEMLFE
jgi:hypothetical protein